MFVYLIFVVVVFCNINKALAVHLNFRFGMKARGGCGTFTKFQINL